MGFINQRTYLWAPQKLYVGAIFFSGDDGAFFLGAQSEVLRQHGIYIYMEVFRDIIRNERNILPE